MAVQEIVQVLVTLMQDDGESLQGAYGPQTVTVARDIAAMLSTRLNEESAHTALWEAFEVNPEAHAAEMVGVLEAMVEADPALARRLDGFAQELYEPLQASGLPSASPQPPPVGEDEEAVDTALSPPIEEQVRGSGPYQADAAAEATFEDSVDRGTYLYGNVKAGVSSVGRDTGVDSFDPANVTRAADVASLSGIPALFERLLAAVAEHPAIEEGRKQDVRVELRILQEQLREPATADPDLITRHLSTLRNTAPDIAEVVIEAVSAIESTPPLEEALAQLRRAPDSETN